MPKKQADNDLLLLVAVGLAAGYFWWQLLQQSTTGTNSSAKNQLNMVGSEIGCMFVHKFDMTCYGGGSGKRPHQVLHRVIGDPGDPASSPALDHGSIGALAMH